MDFVVGGEVDDTDDFVYEQTEAERADGPVQPDDAEMTEAALLETPDSEPLSRADFDLLPLVLKLVEAHQGGVDAAQCAATARELRQRLDRCERLTRQLEAQEASATAAGAGNASVSAAAHLATLERRIAILQKQKDRHKPAT